MKKITESQLKDKVNSLKEYLKVYENQQVDEWSVLSPSSWFNGRDYGDSTSRDDVRTQDAAKNSTAGANMALVQHREQLAPGSVASETGSDGVTYAVDAKGMRTYKIENGKWVAMPTPTPTENPELGGAPAEPEQAASVTARPDPAKVAKFKELLAKAGVSAAPAAAQSPYALQAGGAKLKANESTNYFLNKLRLLESKQLDEALTPEESKQLDKLYGELSVDFKDDPELAPLFADYQRVPTASAAAPAPAPWSPEPAPPERGAYLQPDAAVTASGPITWKQIYELNKDIIGNNPNLIKPGQQLKMPDGSTYTVKPGDNLSKIAKNAAGGQGAKVSPEAPVVPTAPAAPAAPTAPVAPDAVSVPADPRDLEKGQSRGSRPAQPAPNAPGQNARDDLLARQGAKTAPTGIAPGQNARDDLLARQGKVTSESVGYNELQRIVSLVNHR